MPDNIPPDIFEQYENKKPEQGAPLEHREIPAEQKAESRIEVPPPTGENKGETEAAFAEIEKIPEKPGKIVPSEEEKRRNADAMVEKLVDLAKTKGKEAALAEAKNLDPYIQDLLHARLIEEERIERPAQ